MNKKSGYFEHMIQEESEKRGWLWRYMDLAKFLNLLNTRSLYFPSATQFEDKREGLLHHPRSVTFYENLSKILKGKVDYSPTEDNARKVLLRQYYLVSCWNRSSEESVALWKMYTSGYNGVAIRTTVDALSDELKGKTSSLRAQNVEYLPLQRPIYSDDSSPTDSFFRKTPEWAFEREYRVLIDMTQESFYKEDSPEAQAQTLKLGHAIPVNIDNLIKDIRIHYQAPRWLLDDIRSTVEKFGLPRGLVRGSMLNDEY